MAGQKCDSSHRNSEIRGDDTPVVRLQPRSQGRNSSFLLQPSDRSVAPPFIITCNPLAIAAGLRHFPGVRGSPLLKSILVLLGLVVASFGLMRLTHAKAPLVSQTNPAPSATATPPAAGKSLPYRLILSAETTEIRLSAGDAPALSETSGRLELPSEHPLISLTVKWKSEPAPGEHRFAKLILEPTGKPTITHVFDAAGDIDDILELP